MMRFGLPGLPGPLDRLEYAVACSGVSCSTLAPEPLESVFDPRGGAVTAGERRLSLTGCDGAGRAAVR